MLIVFWSCFLEGSNEEEEDEKHSDHLRMKFHCYDLKTINAMIMMIVNHVLVMISFGRIK